MRDGPAEGADQRLLAGLVRLPAGRPLRWSRKAPGVSAEVTNLRLGAGGAGLSGLCEH